MPDWPMPVRTSTPGSALRYSATLALVYGRSKSSSGCAWKSRRRATTSSFRAFTSGEIAIAGSRTVDMVSSLLGMAVAGIREVVVYELDEPIGLHRTLAPLGIPGRRRRGGLDVGEALILLDHLVHRVAHALEHRLVLDQARLGAHRARAGGPPRV